MTTLLNFGRDVQGYNAYAPQQAADKQSVTLTANSATTVTVPSNFSIWIAVFSYTPGAEVWMSDGGTAAVPAGNTFASTTSEMNPAARTVYAADVLSFITANTSVSVSVVFYAIK